MTRRAATPLVDLAAILLLTALALLGLASTFRSWDYLVVALVGAALGIVVVLATLRLPGAVVAVALVVVAGLTGGPVAMRESGAVVALPDPDSVAAVMGGAVTGWHELLTTLPFVDLDGAPALVPFLLGYVGASMAAGGALRGRSVGWPLVPLVAVLVAVLLLRRPDQAEIDSYPVAFAVVALVWLVVRGSRRQALDFPVSGRDHGRAVRLVTAALVLAVGLGVGVSVTSGRPPSAGATLRGQVGTIPDMSELDSPLRRFRTFTKQPDGGSDNVHDKLLLTVTGARPGALLRFVTLDKYDGDEWVASSGTVPGTADDSFLRLDSRVDNPTVGRRATMQVSVAKAYRSVWIPTYGSLTSLHFLYDDAQARHDQLRYDLATSTAILPSEIARGDDYETTSIVPDTRLTRRMRPWPDGVMSVEGIRRADPRLRLVLASKAPAMEKLFVMAGYLKDEGRYSDGAREGESSYTAGHDLRRLMKGFLLTPRPVGDDEQYASAMAIVANRLGIPARVVVGAVVPKDGKVRGRNVHAWIEVRVSDGSWRTLFTDRFMGDKPPKPDMKPATRPSMANVVVPPPEEVTPSEAAVRDRRQQTEEAERRSTAVRWAPWLLILVVALVLPAAKAARRLWRRRRGRSSDRLAGAWEEVVDQARDLGVPVTRGASRPAQARQLARDDAVAGLAGLAARVDDGVFAATEAGPDGVRDGWRAAAAHRRALRRAAPWRRRLWAPFNPASLVGRRPAPARPVVPPARVDAPRVEAGREREPVG